MMVMELGFIPDADYGTIQRTLNGELGAIADLPYCPSAFIDENRRPVDPASYFVTPQWLPSWWPYGAAGVGLAVGMVGYLLGRRFS